MIGLQVGGRVSSTRYKVQFSGLRAIEDRFLTVRGSRSAGQHTFSVNESIILLFIRSQCGPGASILAFTSDHER
jgi:hypothetical protein